MVDKTYYDNQHVHGIYILKAPHYQTMTVHSGHLRGRTTRRSPEIITYSIKSDSNTAERICTSKSCCFRPYAPHTAETRRKMSNSLVTKNHSKTPTTNASAKVPCHLLILDSLVLPGTSAGCFVASSIVLHMCNGTSHTTFHTTFHIFSTESPPTLGCKQPSNIFCYEFGKHW